VIDADLSKYFDTIPHAKLIALVAERIADGGVLHLIQQWLKALVVEEKKDGKERISGGKGNRHASFRMALSHPYWRTCTCTLWIEYGYVIV